MAYTDLYNQYFGGRQQEPDTEANVTPTSTTINYNEDGSHDITHKVNVAPVAPPEGPSPAPVAETPVPPPVTPPPITPTPAANQILSQPPQQGPAVPQAAPQVPTPGTAQMNPAMPTAPVAPPAPGEAAMAQAPAEQLQQQ